VTQAPLCEPKEAPLLGAIEKDLGDRERDELSVADAGSSARSASLGQEIVGKHVNCREKGVEIGEHEASLVCVALSNANFGALRAASSQRGGNLESII
jgi:hypothetical protein